MQPVRNWNAIISFFIGQQIVTIRLKPKVIQGVGDKVGSGHKRIVSLLNPHQFQRLFYVLDKIHCT